MNFRALRIGVLCLAATSWFFAVTSQAVLQLIPPVQEVKVQRGGKGTFTLTIRNVGDNDEPSRFSAHNMDISPDGAPVVSDSGYDRGCGSWIVLDPPEATIKAHESLVLTGTITVPRTAEGGYYAAIKGMFTGTTIPLKAEKVNLKGSQIALESQAIVTVLLTVPSSRNKAIIIPDTLLVYPKGEDTTEVDFSSRSKKGWKVIMSVRNEGNLHTQVSGMVSLWTETGTRIESAPLTAGRGYVFPGKVRNLYAKGENTLSDGYYMIRIALQTAEKRTMSNSFPFAVYKGEVYPDAKTDKLEELIRASAPGFSLKEPFLDKTVLPGGVIHMSVQLMNSRQDTLILYPRKMEWDLDNMGMPVLRSDHSFQPRSCTSWIEFVDQQIQIPPGRNGSLKIKIDPPKDMTGEYYAAIVFDPGKPRPDLPAEFMAARTQLLAFNSPKGSICSIEIDTLTMKKESAKELTLYRFYFTIRNTGNARCYTKGDFSLEKQYAAGVYKTFGKVIEFGDAQAYLLPGGKRKVEVDVPDLEKGKYRAILAISYQEEQQPVTKFQVIYNK